MWPPCRSPTSREDPNAEESPRDQQALPAEIDFGAYRIADPEEFGRNMLRLMEEGGKVMTGLARARRTATAGPISSPARQRRPPSCSPRSPSIGWPTPASSPRRRPRWLRDYLQLAGATAQRMMGAEALPVAEPEPGDNRFNDPEWSRNPYFDFWKQAYLITTRWLEEVLEETDGLDERTRQRAEFYLKQLASALSPSNFPLTNPVVLRETLALERQEPRAGHGATSCTTWRSRAISSSISQTDVEAFEVGRNVATAPGKVVFQNDLLQLIQYAPSTESVHETPLLIVPPWINKFYILDLGPQKSFIRYMVGKGFTVFVVSWVNPDERLKDKTFEDYMTEGLLAATDAVKRETGVEKINVIGYCVGGTLLGTTLAYLAARGEEPFAVGHLLRRPGRLHQGRRPPAVHRRHPAQGAGGDDGGARLSSTARAWPPSSTCCGPRT